MSGIELGNFKKKMLEILEQKEEKIYNKILEKLNLEERRVNLQERAVRIEEELKGQRVLIEKLLHQFDKRFEQVDKHFSIFTWAMGIGFTLTISILVVVLNFVLKM